MPLVDFLATAAEKFGELRDLGLRPLRARPVLLLQSSQLFVVESCQQTLLMIARTRLGLPLKGGVLRLGFRVNTF